MAKKKNARQTKEKTENIVAEETKAVATDRTEAKKENEHLVKICPVILSTYEQTIFSFEGYGISRPFHSMTENVVVEYEGKFGTKDFVIYSVKDYIK